MKFRHGLVAGTFDHLHKGHKKLLKTASQIAEQLACGLSEQNFVNHKPLACLIQSRHCRFHQLSAFLSQQSSQWSIFSLHNSFEPAASSPQLDCIIASRETLPMVKKINRLRQQRQLKPLQPIIINLVQSSDHQPLSSTRIRAGKINRQGFAYQQIFSEDQPLLLPSLARHHFQKPFDQLIQGSPSNLGWAGVQAKQLLQRQPAFMIITVGDIATLTLTQQKITPHLAIVDLKTQRQPLFNSISKLGLSPAHHLSFNPAGQITPHLVRTLNQVIELTTFQNQTQTILIKGEEDLAVLPAILLSPLNSVIFYGQPNQGLVVIRVTETSKQKALQLLQKLITFTYAGRIR